MSFRSNKQGKHETNEEKRSLQSIPDPFASFESCQTTDNCSNSHSMALINFVDQVVFGARLVTRRRWEGLLPSRLNKFLQEANPLFKEGHLLFLVGRVFRLGFCHTFVRLRERSERFVVVLILINFHLVENTTKRENWSELTKSN